eukprot:c13601_g2_i2 orf=1-219(-)
MYLEINCGELEQLDLQCKKYFHENQIICTYAYQAKEKTIHYLECQYPRAIENSIHYLKCEYPRTKALSLSLSL